MFQALNKVCFFQPTFMYNIAILVISQSHLNFIFVDPPVECKVWNLSRADVTTKPHTWAIEWRHHISNQIFVIKQYESIEY